MSIVVPTFATIDFPTIPTTFVIPTPTIVIPTYPTIVLPTYPTYPTTVTPTITIPTTIPTPNTTPTNASIAGGIIGTFAFIFVLACIMGARRKKKRREQDAATQNVARERNGTGISGGRLRPIHPTLPIRQGRCSERPSVMDRLSIDRYQNLMLERWLHL
jgi:hypothetical protein